MAPPHHGPYDFDRQVTRGVLFPSPPNAYAPVSGEPFVLRPWLRALNEALFVVVLIIATVLGAFLNFPSISPVLERDPSYSYPVEEQSVTNLFLLITVTCLPLLGALAIHLASLFAALYLQGLLRREATTVGTNAAPATELSILQMRRARLVKQHVKAAAWFFYAYVQAFLLAASLLLVLKKIFAYPRPNFFALCNYNGYGDAVASGNFASYLASTDPNRLASLSNCRGSQSDVDSSIESFVSGHALLSFALLGFFTLYLRAAFGVPAYSFMTLTSFFCAFPLLIAAWFSISRVRDRWHRTEDIIAGTLLGLMTAWFVWEHNYRLYHQGRLQYPYPVQSAVTAGIANRSAVTSKSVYMADTTSQGQASTLINPFYPSSTAKGPPAPLPPPAEDYLSHNATSMAHGKEVPALILIAAGVEQQGMGVGGYGYSEGDVELVESKQGPTAPNAGSAASFLSPRSRSQGSAPKRSQPGYRAFAHKQAVHGPHSHQQHNYKPRSQSVGDAGGFYDTNGRRDGGAVAPARTPGAPVTIGASSFAQGTSNQPPGYSYGSYDAYRLTENFQHPSWYHGGRPLVRLVYYSRTLPFSVAMLPARQVAVKGVQLAPKPSQGKLKQKPATPRMASVRPPTPRAAVDANLVVATTGLQTTLAAPSSVRSPLRGPTAAAAATTVVAPLMTSGAGNVAPPPVPVQSAV